MNDKDLTQPLKDYIDTWNSGKYSSTEELNAKFPEFSGFDETQKQALKDYVDTWNSGKYKSVDEMNLKFPEFFPVKKKVGAEPSLVSKLPSSGENAFIKPVQTPVQAPVKTESLIPQPVLEYGEFTKNIPKGKKVPTQAEFKQAQELAKSLGILPKEPKPQTTNVGAAGMLDQKIKEVEPKRVPLKETVKAADYLQTAINNDRKTQALSALEDSEKSDFAYSVYQSSGGELDKDTWKSQEVERIKNTDFALNEIKARNSVMPTSMYDDVSESTPNTTASTVLSVIDNYPDRANNVLGGYIYDYTKEYATRDPQGYKMFDAVIRSMSKGESTMSTVTGTKMAPEVVGSMMDMKVSVQNKMMGDMGILANDIESFNKKYSSYKSAQDNILAKAVDLQYYDEIIREANSPEATPEQIAKAQSIEGKYKAAYDSYQRDILSLQKSIPQSELDAYNEKVSTFNKLKESYGKVSAYFGTYEAEMKRLNNKFGEVNTNEGFWDGVADGIELSYNTLIKGAVQGVANTLTGTSLRAASAFTGSKGLEDMKLRYDAYVKYKGYDYPTVQGTFVGDVGYEKVKNLTSQQKKDLAIYNPGINLEKLKPEDYVRTEIDEFKPVNFVATVAATVGEMYLLYNKGTAALSELSGASRLDAMTLLAGMRSYEDNYSRMLNTEGLDETERHFLAFTLSSLEGLSERIMPDYKLFGEDKSLMVNELTRAYLRGGRREALRTGAKYLKQFGEENVEEFAVIFGTEAVEGLTNTIKDKQIFEPSDIIGELEQTALITSAVMGVVGVPTGFRVASQMITPENVDTQNLIYLSQSPNFRQLPQVLEELRVGGEITGEKARDILDAVSSVREVITKLPLELSKNFKAIRLLVEREELISQLQPVDKGDFFDRNVELQAKINDVEKELTKMNSLDTYQAKNIKEVNYFVEKKGNKTHYFKQEVGKPEERLSRKAYLAEIKRLKSFGADITTKGGLVTIEEVRDKINVYRSQKLEGLTDKIKEVREKIRAQMGTKPALTREERRKMLSEVIDKLNPAFRTKAAPAVETAIQELESGKISKKSIEKLTKGLRHAPQFAGADTITFDESTQEFVGKKAGKVINTIPLQHIKGNTEWINPFTFSDDTLIHEFAGHPYVSTLANEAATKSGQVFNFADQELRDSELERLMSTPVEELNPQAQVLRKGFELIRGTEYHRNAMTAGYSGEYGSLEEALVQAIGDYGAKLETQEERTRFMDIIRDLIAWLGGKAFKNKGLTPEQFRTMTTEKYMAAVMSDITVTEGVAPTQLGTIVNTGVQNFQIGVSAKELKAQNPIQYFNILTKEIYERVKQSSTFFPHPEVQGKYRGSEAELITRLLDITGRISQDPGLSPLGAIKEQGEIIENFAKESGFFFESTDEFENGDAKAGMESVVYLQKDGKSVVKISSPELNEDWYEFIYHKFILHNLYFPNTAYNFVGVTKRGDRVYMLLSQRAVGNEHKFVVSSDEGWSDVITDWFEPFGFTINATSTIEYPDGTIITDLHPGNVFLFKGQLYIIDPFFAVEGTSVDILMDEILNESSPLFQIIGEQGAQYLPKISNDLTIAQAMERDLGLEIDYWDVPDKEQLKKMYKIRLATGWERGKDGLWRYELEPIKLKFSTKDGLQKVLEGKPVMSEGAIRVPLSEIIDVEPFGQHYNLDDVFVFFDPSITIDNAHYTNNGIGVSLTLKSLDSGVTILKTVLSHELQHHIQKKEGFNMGSSTRVRSTLRGDIEEIKEKIKELKRIKEIVDEEDIPKYDSRISELSAKLSDFTRLYYQVTDEDEYKLYFKSYVEVEARNVENRIGMSKSERLATLLRHTEDVAPEYQVLVPEATFKNSLTEGSENMVVIMSKILGRGFDDLSDTDIKSRYDQFMKEIEEAEGATPTVRALRVMEDDIIDDAVKFQLIYHGGEGILTEWDESKFKGGFRGSHGWGMYFSSSKYKAEDYGEIKAVFDDADFNYFDLDKTVTEESIKDLTIRLGGEKAWVKFGNDSISIQTENDFYDIILHKLLKQKGKDFETARKNVMSEFIWDAEEKYAKMLVAAGYDAVSTDKGYYFVIINGQKYNEVYNKYKELGEMPDGVKFQITDNITPEIENRIKSQLDKEGYVVLPNQRFGILWDDGTLELEPGDTGETLYSDILYPIFGSRIEALRFLNRAGISMSIPQTPNFQITPSIPTDEIRTIIDEGLDLMYTPELIRNSIISMYQLKTKAQIDALDVIMDEVYNAKTGKYIVLKDRRSARKAIRNNRGDKYVAETIHDIGARWGMMSDVDREIVQADSSTTGKIAWDILELLRLREEGKEGTKEYMEIYERVKVAGTDVAKALSAYKLLSHPSNRKMDFLNEKFKNRKLPDSVKKKFKQIFDDIDKLTREIKMGQGVLPEADLKAKQFQLEELNAAQDLLWRQFNPIQSSNMGTFTSLKGNLFKLKTQVVNVMSNVANFITKGVILFPLRLFNTNNIPTFKDYWWATKASLPITLQNIIENFRYGTYTSASGDKSGGYGTPQALRYFNPLVETVRAMTDMVFTSKSPEEIAEKYNFLLKPVKNKAGTITKYRISKGDMIRKTLMGSVGANSDLMLRMLVLGDVPFSNVTYLAELRKLARIEGITSEKGISEFVDSPPPWAHDVAVRFGKASTLTQDNFVTKGVVNFKHKLLTTGQTSPKPLTKIGASIGYGLAELILPFTHVPLNFSWGLAKMMAPGLYTLDIAVIGSEVYTINAKIDKESNKDNPDKNAIASWLKTKKEHNRKLKLVTYEMGMVYALHQLLAYMALSGAFYASGGEDDKEFKKRQMDENRINIVNFSMFYRWFTRDITKKWEPFKQSEQPTDIKIDLSKLGIVGLIPTILANQYYLDSKKSAEKGLPWDVNVFDKGWDSIIGLFDNVGVSFQESLQLTFLQSISKISTALSAKEDSGAQKLANVTTDLINTAVTQVLFPNNAVGIAQTNRDYIPASNKRFNTEAFPLDERLSNLLKNKINVKGQAITDEFGRDVPQTPKDYIFGDGKFARWIYHNADIFRPTKVGSKGTTAEAMYHKLDDYMLRGTFNGIAAPEYPNKLKDKLGISYDMTPEQYYKYSQELGQYKLALVQKIFESPGISTLLTLANPELEANVELLNSEEFKGTEEWKQLMKEMQGERVLGIIDDNGNKTPLYDALILKEKPTEQVRYAEVREIVQKTLWDSFSEIKKQYDDYFLYTQMTEQLMETPDSVKATFTKAEVDKVYSSVELQKKLEESLNTMLEKLKAVPEVNK